MPEMCALSGAIGNDEECGRGWCAFWEHGGAIVEPGCTVQRLGLDLENIDLVHYLLDLRRALNDAQNEEESLIARRQLAELVPPDLSGA